METDFPERLKNTGEITNQLPPPSPERNCDFKTVAGIEIPFALRMKQEGKGWTRTLKSAKGNRVIRERWIEQSLETFTASLSEGLAGSHQKFAPQSQQFSHAQTKLFLKLKLEMNQGKFNIGRE
jgi:hypothetical protein